MSNIKYIISLFLLATMVSCKDDNHDDEQFENTEHQVVYDYSKIVLATYEDALSDALELQSKVNELVGNPSEQTLTSAKDAWLAARETYGQTEAFRFYGGPIDDEDGPEGRLNAWPLDESYIDYVVVSEEAVDGTNIINSPDLFPTISAEVIASLNEEGGETNISSGYHAIEFLLWGQDLSNGPGGGDRPYTDYATSEGSNLNQARRATYLVEVTKLLVSDLTSLVDEWKEDGDYRTAFEADPDEAIKKILTGLGKLSKGELAGERMFVAYDLRSKEDEQSCFSDNTHRDIVTDALGIHNVFLATYKRTNGSILIGTSVYDLISLKNLTLADEIKDKIAESVTLCETIQAPFDQEFLNEDGRARILFAINSLRAQGDLLAEGAQALEFTFDPGNLD